MSKMLEELNKKRIEVLKEIKPMCEEFKLDCGFIVKENGHTETLILNGQKIGCSMNSIYAIKNEIIGYIFAEIYCKDKWWNFKPHTLKYIKQYWLN